MTTKEYFLTKINNPQNLNESGAYDEFCRVLYDIYRSEYGIELEDIYPDDYEDMPLSVQISDRYLMEVVPHLGIEPGDFEAEDYYEAATCLD